LRPRHPGSCWTEDCLGAATAFLAGALGFYLTSFLLFASGIPLTPLHGWLIPGIGAVYYALCGGPGAPAKLARRALAFFCAVTVVGAAFAFLSARFYDLSWDGMAIAQERILALTLGWNPVRDPHFQEGTRLLAGTVPGKYPPGVAADNATGFPQLVSAALALTTGSLSAGKAVTALLAVLAFLSVWGCVGRLGFKLWGGFWFSVAVSLHPVAIYQSSSYYLDGCVASLFSSLLFLALVLARQPSLLLWGAVASAFLLLSASKTSGFWYGALLITTLSGTRLWANPRQWRPVLFFLFLGILGGAGIRGLAGLRIPQPSWKTVEDLQAMTDRRTEGFGVGSGSFGWSQLAELDPLRGFLLSHASVTAPMPSRPELKPPFWFTRPELSVFEDLSPDPRSGGFGPLYSGALLAGVWTAVVSLLRRPAPPVWTWLPLVPVVGSLWFTQSWWARWAPQGWLLPLLLVFPCLIHEPRPSRPWPVGFAWWTLATCLLNSCLILVFYSLGCIRSQRVVEQQLSFLRNLPSPLELHWAKFPAPRLWLGWQQIPFEKTPEDPPRPRLVLLRSDTRVALPPDWQQLPLPTKERKEWEKRRLFEL